jgi:hypothetical protein
MRESTSPTRSPPRAMQISWLNCQSDSCDLPRQLLDQHVYWSQ